MDADASITDEGDIPEPEFLSARLFLLAVLTILMVPGLLLIGAGTAPLASGEQRTLSALPSMPASGMEYRTFPTRFQMYVDDHFGFRDTLLSVQHQLQFEFWGQPTLHPSETLNPLLNQAAAAQISNDVLVGREGWLFFKGDRLLDDARGLRPFDPKELTAWISAFEQNRRLLAERGIQYVVVFVPNKMTVYPEHLPSGIHFSEDRRRLPQLIVRLDEDTEVEAIDLTPVLRTLKSKLPCYYQTDTHWNEPGACFALHHLLRRIDIEPRTLPEPETALLREHRVAGRDLSRMLGLGSNLSETTVELQNDDLPSSSPIQLTNSAPGAGVCTQFVNPHAENRPGRVMLFHDSFGLEWYPWLARECSELTCCWNFGLDFERIDAAKPNLVIHQIVERMLPVGKPDELRTGN